MSRLTIRGFENFFEYYKGEPQQKEAVAMLWKAMPVSLLEEDAAWIKTYRSSPEPEPEPVPNPGGGSTTSWPLTKEQLGQIMLCSAGSLPDSLMDDLAECFVTFLNSSRIGLAYFLGQCGHESAGLRYPMEIHDGSNYEWRQDLGNNQPGDGVKFAGTGFIQVTGRANHQDFANYMQLIGKPDRFIMETGKTYTCEVYPWSISGNWWMNNDMPAYCETRPDVDRVGQRVNGRYLPNGYQDRRDYTYRAFSVLGV